MKVGILGGAVLGGAGGPGPPGPPGPAGSLTDTDVVVADYDASVGELVLIDGTVPGITITLPSAVGQGGQEIVLAEVEGGSCVFRAAAQPGEEVGGVAARSFGGPGTVAVLRSDDASWLVEGEPGLRPVEWSDLPSGGGIVRLAFPNCVVRGPGDGSFSVTLPLAAECPGTSVLVKETLADNVANHVDIAALSGDTIDESPTYVVPNATIIAFLCCGETIYQVSSQYPSGASDPTFAGVSAAIQGETGASIQKPISSPIGEGGLEGVSANGVTCTVIPEATGLTSYRVFRLVILGRVTAATPLIVYSYTVQEGHRVQVHTLSQGHELSPVPANDADYGRFYSAMRLPGGVAIQRLPLTAEFAAEVVGSWNSTIQLSGNNVQIRVDTGVPAPIVVDFIVEAIFRDWTFPTS